MSLWCFIFLKECNKTIKNSKHHQLKINSTEQKMKFLVKYFFSKYDQILNGKLDFYAMQFTLYFHFIKIIKALRASTQLSQLN